MSEKMLYERAGFVHGTLLRVQLQELTGILADHSYPVQQDELVESYREVTFDIDDGTQLHDMLTQDVYTSKEDVTSDINQYLSSE